MKNTQRNIKKRAHRNAPPKAVPKTLRQIAEFYYIAMLNGATDSWQLAWQRRRYTEEEANTLVSFVSYFASIRLEEMSDAEVVADYLKRHGSEEWYLLELTK